VVSVVAGGVLVAAAPAQAASATVDPAIGCSTKVFKNNRTFALDTWQVGMECWSNPTDRPVFIRGVLDVPAALDGHTPWVEIPPHTFQTPARQVLSYETTSPWGTPSSRLEEYKCPPVVIGECSPFNKNGEVVLAFGTLLTSLF
jgi:hypothetical protein